MEPIHYLPRPRGAKLACALAVAVFASACGGGGGGGGGDSGVVDCGAWPEFAPLAAGAGHGAVTAVVVLDRCNIAIAGYEGSSTAGQVNGDSRGFVRRLRLDAQGLQTRWQYFVDTAGSDAVTGLELDGGELVFTGFVEGELPNAGAQGKRDVVIGALSLDGEVGALAQLGTSRPNTPLHRLVTDSGEQYLVGSDEVHVPTNFVERWEDPWVAGITRQGEAFTLDWLNNSDTPEGDFYTAAALYEYTFLLGLNSSGGPAAGAQLQARTLTGELYWSVQVSPMPYDAIADLALTADGRLLALGTTYLSLGDTPLGAGDYFLLEVEPSSGEIVETTQFGSAGLDWARRLLLDGSRRLVLGEVSDGNPPWSLEVLALDARGSEVARVRRTFGVSTRVAGGAPVPGGVLAVGAYRPQGAAERGYVAFLPI